MDRRGLWGVVALVVTLGGCGSSSAKRPDGGDGAAATGCQGGPPPTLVCGTDRVGAALAPECPGTEWVCPVGPARSGCAADASASCGATGVACGTGACPAGMVCDGEQPATCVPFPPACANAGAHDAGWSAICGCLMGQPFLEDVCRPIGGAACEAPDGGFVVVCTVGSRVPPP